MTGRDYYTVGASLLNFTHLVGLGMFFDGSGAALCGKRPFPERWGLTDGAGSKLCPNCADRVRWARTRKEGRAWGPKS